MKEPLEQLALKSKGVRLIEYNPRFLMADLGYRLAYSQSVFSALKIHGRWTETQRPKNPDHDRIDNPLIISAGLSH
jgi:hypothetical protein